ncbi:hypothetical protein JJB99_21245 [Bradyrhizobium diazoefficiens]|uniref:hypothetical protein n=1 Tax=Bradyrhizobium diazoefficiens TaxID=1355477 RepID=UPI00190CA2EF|nr:hypothetical protein [Bradyrhizobium diazoefficiens]QQO12021.1 hypothetical protein JJB99_21245 [Bradyrhizobium diazoefficiens]
MAGHVAASITIEIAIVLRSARSEAVIAAAGVPEKATAGIAVEHYVTIRSDVADERVVAARRAADQVFTGVSVHREGLMRATGNAKVVVATKGVIGQGLASIAVGIHFHPGRKGLG